ncbi:MAG: alpha-ketoglutarate-dependent dioxygenase AlkB [Rhizomicrobium sp.]
MLAAKVTIMEGVVLWTGALDVHMQSRILREIFAKTEDAPFYTPTMPGSGAPFSVQETNFGSLGWISDRNGYRYEPNHPVTKKPWPAIPPVLLELWREATQFLGSPECCLVNLYRGAAKMGLHQDKDEAALAAPVLSVSLGDDALFRIGGPTRKGTTKSLKLASGDVLMFGGRARLAFHGIDRVIAGTSRLVPGGGRLNLTWRRMRP